MSCGAVEALALGGSMNPKNCPQSKRHILIVCRCGSETEASNATADEPLSTVDASQLSPNPDMYRQWGGSGIRMRTTHTQAPQRPQNCRRHAGRETCLCGPDAGYVLAMDDIFEDIVSLATLAVGNNAKTANSIISICKKPSSVYSIHIYLLENYPPVAPLYPPISFDKKVTTEFRSLFLIIHHASSSSFLFQHLVVAGHHHHHDQHTKHCCC